MTGFYGFYFFFHVLASSLSPTTTPFFLCLSAAFFRDAMARLMARTSLLGYLFFTFYISAPGGDSRHGGLQTYQGLDVALVALTRLRSIFDFCRFYTLNFFPQTILHCFCCRAFSQLPSHLQDLTTLSRPLSVSSTASWPRLPENSTKNM